MRYPQLLVCEADGSLARLLQPLVRTEKWSMREPRRWQSCYRLLQTGRPSVVILTLEKRRDTPLVSPDGSARREEEMLPWLILDRASWLFPDVPLIAVSETEDIPAVHLAWELGATFVLFPPFKKDELPEIARRLMCGLTDKHPTASRAQSGTVHESED